MLCDAQDMNASVYYKMRQQLVNARIRALKKFSQR